MIWPDWGNRRKWLDAEIRAARAETHRDHLLLRVQALELERTELLNRLLATAKVEPVPHVAPSIALGVPRTETPPAVSVPVPDALWGDLAAGFEDIGDEVAAKLGIQHTATGTVEYRR